eukprot:TRINITY_DN7455_c0_g1_i1.p1 TRINITY_DN7455_c0_g1~~TRINITY_DN7455_c0_g1_i1.p1  ORF type:complete len:172 (+),score=29.21 TRINITY_DN7455_c0_g1_i1:2-517(+)
MSGLPIRLPGTVTTREWKRFWRPISRKKLKKEREIRDKMYGIMKEAMMTKIDPLPVKKQPLLPPVSRKSFHVNINKLQITDADLNSPTPDQFPIVRERVKTLMKLGFSQNIIESRINTEFLSKLDKRDAQVKADIIRQEIEKGVKSYEEEVLRLSAPSAQSAQQPKLDKPS